MRDQQDYDLIFLLQYFGVAILQTMKDVLKDCEIEYGYESFNNDVKKWKSWIKAEYPLESWQPSLAASEAITL